MWAIRRASNQFRNKGLAFRSGQIFCGKTEFERFPETCNNGVIVAPQETMCDVLLSGSRFYSKSHGFPREVRTFSSQVGAKNSGEDMEDGFSELETPHDTVEEVGSGDEKDDDLESELELSDEEGIVDDALDEPEEIASETERNTNISSAKGSSPLIRAIMSDLTVPVSKGLDKWIEEGNEVTQSDALRAMNILRKRRLFVKALQLSEWLEANKHYELNEATCISRVDLIAKVHGVFRAENYMKKLPESLRTEAVYRTLLANCVVYSNVKKAEEIFNNMRNLKFPITSFACNQLLLLYKRTDRKKIADVLRLMEIENVKLSVFTYHVLVDVKGMSNDITGMEQVVEMMEAQELKPSSQIQASMARYYANAGMKDKAKALLKELEGDDLLKNRWACRILIPIYASLGRTEEVERIWNVCESDLRLEDCLAAIAAWGQLKKVEKAEEAFEKLLKKVGKPSSKHYNALLKVYANNKMLNKGKELVNQMAASRCTLGPLTWDALVKLYVGAGEVEKADSILRKAISKKIGKPLFTTYVAIMERYAERGDVHNAEKIFQMMRSGGYVARIRQYQLLLNTYQKAKKPAYGFRDRMKADSISPNRSMADQLAKMDIFRKSAVDDLLE